MFEARRKFLGRPYETKLLQLMRSAVDEFGDFILFKNSEDASSVFCSELIAATFQEVGILNKKAKPSNEYTPQDFSRKGDKDLPLANVDFSWGEEITITWDGK